jgi:hypothetical protein
VAFRESFLGTLFEKPTYPHLSFVSFFGMPAE